MDAKSQYGIYTEASLIKALSFYGYKGKHFLEINKENNFYLYIYTENDFVKIINTDVLCCSISSFLKAKNIEIKGKQFEMIKEI